MFNWFSLNYSFHEQEPSGSPWRLLWFRRERVGASENDTRFRVHTHLPTSCSSIRSDISFLDNIVQRLSRRPMGATWPTEPAPSLRSFQKNVSPHEYGCAFQSLAFRLVVESLLSIPYACSTNNHNVCLNAHRPRSLAGRLLPSVRRWRAHARHGPPPSAVRGQFGQGLGARVRARASGRPPGRLHASERRVCRAPAAQHLSLALASPHRLRNALRRYES